jgi:tetratricopeptide (TPR) repeat protein
MNLGSAPSRYSDLWQFPLLLVALTLFGVAAYLFIDPKAGPTLEQRLAEARRLLEQERPEAALDGLNSILRTEKLDAPTQGTIHLMIAESLEMAQKQRRKSVPENHRRIIEQSRLALGRGVKPEAGIFRRMAESYEALGKTPDALTNYRKAMALDPQRALRLQRKIIDLQLIEEDTVGAEASLADYLTDARLSDGERVWALGMRGQLLSDAGRFAEARGLLEEALKLATDPVAKGEVNLRIGYALWKLNDAAQAERYLRFARDLLGTRHPVDADAAYILGRLRQDAADWKQAMAFYQDVIVSHVDSPHMPLALMGRGMCRLQLGQDDAGLTDFQEVVRLAGEPGARRSLKAPVLEGLQKAGAVLTDRGNLPGAIELLSYEQSLEPEPSSGFYARLGRVFEKRADELQTRAQTAGEAERVRLAAEARQYRTRAGDAMIALSRKLTLADDKGYADALWKGVELYDQAGSVQHVISALELFVAEKPDDPMAPDALLRLGRAFQATGEYEKAIAAYQRNQFRYPQSLAASKSAVPLAQALMARGSAFHGQAEATLLSVVENNPLLEPESEEYKQALVELAHLYYRDARYEDAVVRLEELVRRYPQEQRTGQLLFLMADSYRKSSGLLSRQLSVASTSESGVAGLKEAESARKDRLASARMLYDRAIDYYRSSPPMNETDRLYQKLAHFYRADCVFDMGDFEQAIVLYDAAAFRYQDDPSALAAHVQIVNAYCALGKVDQARTANERAKVLLRRMPPEAFVDGTFSMPREYWEQWLRWSSESGMW